MAAFLSAQQSSTAVAPSAATLTHYVYELRVPALSHNGVEKLVTIHQQDLFSVDLRDATVVMLYLSTKYNARLVPQLDRLRPGSRIVSHLFEIPGIKPDRVVTVKSKVDGRIHNMFLWTTPLKHSRGP